MRGFGGRQIAVAEGQPKLETAENLSGKTVGVASQSTHYYWLQENVPDAKLKIYPNDPDMFEEAELGRIDALVTNTPVILAGIAAGEPLVLCGEPLYYENASFTLAQGGADWRAVLNDCIETMHSSGCLEEKSVLWNNGLDLTVSLPAEFDLQLWEETLPSGVDYLPLGLMLRRGQSGLHVRLRFNVSE